MTEEKTRKYCRRERAARNAQNPVQNQISFSPTMRQKGTAMMAEQQFIVRDQREPGWFFIDNEIVDKFGARLGAYGVALYAVLARHCKNSTQQVNLSQRDIAATLKISQDRVRTSLGELVDEGLIHVEVPARPSPGIISTITMLKVKTTERHTFSSTAELNATRSRNKEIKTKTETKTETAPIFYESVFALEENARAREDAAKSLCERTAFPDTPSNVAVVAAAIKAIQKQNGTAHREAAAWLEGCVRYVQAKDYPDLRLDRFFFEDAKYNSIGVSVGLNFSPSCPSQEPAPPVCIVGKCQGCGRPRLDGSSWSDYCADSCRDAHKRATA